MQPLKRFLETAVLIGVLVPLALAQGEVTTKREESEKELANMSRVTMGDSAGTPGSSVAIPVYFSAAEVLQVGHLRLEVAFVSTHLNFSSFDRGVAADLGNVHLSVETKQSQNERGTEVTTLTMTASVESNPPTEKGIPPGLLTLLLLQVDNDARPASITLHISAQARELNTGKPVQDLQVLISS